MIRQATILRLLHRSKVNVVSRFRRIRSVSTASPEIKDNRMAKLLTENLIEEYNIKAKAAGYGVMVSYLQTEEEIAESHAVFEMGRKMGAFDEVVYKHIDDFRRYILQDNTVCILFKDEAINDLLAGFIMFSPSYFARGSPTITYNGLTCIHPDYQGTQLFIKGYLFGSIFGIHLGFRGGVLTRALSSHGEILGAVTKMGATLCACIPYGAYVPRKGYVSDVIFGHLFPNNKNPDEPWEEEKLGRELRMFMTSPEIQPYCFEKTNLVFAGNTIATVALATQEEMQTLNSIILEKAELGEEFGFDEFDADGSFNYRFLQKHNALIARTSNGGEFCGGIIFGVSNLLRTRPSANEDIVLHFYPAMAPTYSKPEYSLALCRLFLQWARRQRNVLGVMTDVYDSNWSGTVLCKQLGMMSTGILPDCGTMKHLGRCNSQLFFSSFRSTLQVP